MNPHQTDWIIRGGAIVTRDSLLKGDIWITNGRIAEIASEIHGIHAPEIDASNRIVLPGLVDPHVHFSLPVGDRITSDDFAAGSRAALFGGITSVIDFSTPSKGMSLSDSIHARVKEVHHSRIDVGLHGTICGWKSSQASELRSAIDLGVTSFKFFTTYEESGRRTSYEDLEIAASICADLGVLMTVHAEDSTTIRDATPSNDQFMYYESSRPETAEAIAVSHLADICRSSGVMMYVVHLSSMSGFAAAGTDLILETCPQYLVLDKSAFQGDDGYRFAVAPPLRDPQSQAVLWEGLQSGRISTIGTDHCVFSPDAYRVAGNHFRKTPYGLPGVETSLPLMVTYGVLTGRLSWQLLIRLMSENPARIFGLWPRKGTIQPGADADLVILDPNLERSVNPLTLHSRTDWNPYRGMVLRGWPEIVLSRGRIAVSNNHCWFESGDGQYLFRGTAHRPNAVV